MWSKDMWFIGVWFIGALGSGRWAKVDHGAVTCTGGTEEKKQKSHVPGKNFSTHYKTLCEP